MDLQVFYDDILIKSFPRVSLVLSFPAQPLLGALIPSRGFKQDQKVSPLLWVSPPTPGAKAAGLNRQLLAGHLHLGPRGPKLDSVSFPIFILPSSTFSSAHDTSTHPNVWTRDCRTIPPLCPSPHVQIVMRFTHPYRRVSNKSHLCW